MNQLCIAPDAESLAEAAAARVVAIASEAIAQRGRFVLALAGGSTPRTTYRLLARAGQGAIDWSSVELFFGDERCVPPDDRDSNYRMAREELIDSVGLPADRVHRIKGEIRPQEAAASYEKELRDVLGENGRFDLILLGLGADGHTASLFPGAEAVGEKARDAVAVYVEKLDAWRVTLTLPIINQARHVIFLVSGAAKADALARVEAGEDLPAAMVQPATGTLTWLVDREAAGDV